MKKATEVSGDTSATLHNNAPIITKYCHNNVVSKLTIFATNTSENGKRVGDDKKILLFVR